jgi:hypothetical protein
LCNALAFFGFGFGDFFVGVGLSVVDRFGVGRSEGFVQHFSCGFGLFAGGAVFDVGLGVGFEDFEAVFEFGDFFFGDFFVGEEDVDFLADGEGFGAGFLGFEFEGGEAAEDLDGLVEGVFAADDEGAGFADFNELLGAKAVGGFGGDFAFFNEANQLLHGFGAGFVGVFAGNVDFEFGALGEGVLNHGVIWGWSANGKLYYLEIGFC